MAQDPARSALFLDFDGTLAAIVEEPEEARALPGVGELLARLAARLQLVAVISGRPRSFLSEVLGAPAGVTLVGLYGLELALEGDVAKQWRREMDDTVAQATVEAPDGVFVEPKGLTVTLHWRQAPETEEWVESFCRRQGTQRGLGAFPARSSIELRPPVKVDKGTVVHKLVDALPSPPAHLAVFGDDLGDLPAFDAANALARERADLQALRVAAVDPESPAEVAAQADVVVEGASGAVALLEQLAQAIDAA